ncbi:hypothetical protein [Lysinibacillus cavernae]|uniref:hypothetical protein n=1 Tax=Lysinibacillus cavernae TaxID=2666135 RepID=UPI0012D86DE6|nr:hypothetical protein [Lysinibacillus cavernae]
MVDENKKINKWLLLISIILVICLPFILGSRENLNVHGDREYLKAIYGFPFDWLHLYPNNRFSFLWIGFILNIMFFYYMIKLFIWIYKKIVGMLRWMTT